MKKKIQHSISSTPSDMVESITSQADQSGSPPNANPSSNKASKPAQTPKRKRKRRPPASKQSTDCNGTNQPPKIEADPDTAAQTTPHDQTANINVSVPSQPDETVDQSESADVASGHVEPMPTSPGTGSITDVTVPIDLIDSNDYNFNEMTQKEKDSYKNATRRLGCLPKKPVLRPVSGRYVTLDGAHGVGVAKELGWLEIPCKIMEVEDDFEAMRQSDERNRHGRTNKVKHGGMLLRCQKIRGLSQRELAKEFNITEGTVRNHILYANACNLRNAYAQNGEKVIAALTVEQVRHYMGMGKQERDHWLDAGAHMHEAKQQAPTNQKPSGDILAHYDLPRPLEPVDASNDFPAAAVQANAAGADEAVCEPTVGHQEADLAEVNPQSTKTESSNSPKRVKKKACITYVDLELASRGVDHSQKRLENVVDKLLAEGELDPVERQTLDALLTLICDRVQQMREKLKAPSIHTTVVPTTE